MSKSNGIGWTWLFTLAVTIGASPVMAGPPLRETIDRLVEAKWKEQNITPAPLAEDGVFLRRVYLDLIGRIPTVDEARAFLDDESPDKRTVLIDRLLDDPGYPVQQRDVWDLLLFSRSPRGYGTYKRPTFQEWLRRQFADNVPYDQWVGALLRAEGNTAEQGPPMYMMQFVGTPEDAAMSVTSTFLGMQLQCARCHDHPYDDFTQLDFYGMAGFFARVRRVDFGQKNGEHNFMLGEMTRGELLFTGPAADQKPGQKGEPVSAKFLKGDTLAEPEVPKEFEEPRNLPANKVPAAPLFSRKNALAEWVTKADNPYFARAVANRVWAQYMGRGIVHPVDNLGSLATVPSHPELLDALTEAMVERKFDLKWFIRELVNSKTYQLASTGPVTDDLPHYFERAPVRPISFEQWMRSFGEATGWAEAQRKAGKDPMEAFNATLFNTMRGNFGQPQDGTGVFQPNMLGHLQINNDEYFRRVYTYTKDGMVDRLANKETPVAERVEHLFLATVARRPREAEVELFSKYLESSDKPRDTAEEALWVLVTSGEFRFNH